MQIIDRGSGPPLVLIPGLQGRWEYLRPAVEALSSCFRVVTFSLEAVDLDGYAAQVGRAMSDKGIERATICGVSFGGLIAVRFAAVAGVKFTGEHFSVELVDGRSLTALRTRPRPSHTRHRCGPRE